MADPIESKVIQPTDPQNGQKPAKIERKYDPEKELKAKQKRKEYNQRYQQKLKQRAADGDEKANSIMAKKEEKLKALVNNMKPGLRVAPSQVPAKTEVKQPDPVQSIAKAVVEQPELPVKVEVKQPPIEFATKEKYKKLKQRVNQLEDAVLQKTVKPKFRSAIYDKLFNF